MDRERDTSEDAHAASPPSRRRPIHVKIGFAIAALVLFLVILEAGLRLLYYQVMGTHALAIQGAVAHGRRVVSNREIERRMAEVLALKKKYRGATDALYRAEGAALLKEFRAEYEKHFALLASTAEQAETKLVVLYLPSRILSDPEDVSAAACRGFYSDLCKKYGVDFLDFTACLNRHPEDRVTLSPQNAHLSRFGNQLVAGALAVSLDRFKDCRSSKVYRGKPGVCGRYEPGDDYVASEDTALPYRVVVNRQGFRMQRDLDIPKTRRRVLILGDSFTYGPYLHNHDTYPALLQAVRPDLEIVNAGAAGFSIPDEASMFVERAQYIAPDITVLQVLDNDVDDFFYFVRNQFDRKCRTHRPTTLEQAFLDRVAERNRGGGSP